MDEMPSVDDIVAHCTRIGAELCSGELSRYDYIDRATALGLLRAAIERYMSREDATASLASVRLKRIQGHIDALRSKLHEVEREAHAAQMDALQEMVLDAYRELNAACQILTEPRQT